MPDHFINEVPVVIAGTGEGFLKILEAAKDGNALAIIVLVGCALSVGYVAWSVIKHLLPTPKTARWRRWRTIGLISLFCFPLSCVAFWIWIKDSLIVFFAPLVFVFLAAYSSKECRDESARFNSSDTHETPLR